MSRSPDLEQQLLQRADEARLPVPLLRAVYLRETREADTGGTALTAAALCRVDEFICYVLERDTRCARDRDLAPSVTLR